MTLSPTDWQPLQSAFLNAEYRLCFAVPGAPITAFTTAAASWRWSLEWSLNEKIAFEAAFGASLVGVRSVVAFKQNGMNVALDSILNSTDHTIGAAIILMVGDDVDLTKSTALQDSRMLAHIANIPVFEPIGLEDFPACVDEATALSEASSRPVLLRFTSSLATLAPNNSTLPNPVGAVRTAGTVNFKRHRAHGLTKLSRSQRAKDDWETIVQPAYQSGAVGHCACDDVQSKAVISFGSLGNLVPEGAACTLSLRIPTATTAVEAFVENHDQILILEEPLSFFEEQLKAVIGQRSKIVGRLSGHLPKLGPIPREDVLRFIKENTAVQSSPIALLERPSPSGGSDEYPQLFEALGAVGRLGTFIATDVGSSVSLCYPPYNAAHSALSLGSAVAVASGAGRTGRKAIAVIGDYGLLHSGFQGVIEVARRRLPVSTIVLANGIQRKTGGQPAVAIEEAVNDMADYLEELMSQLGDVEILRWCDSRMEEGQTTDLIDRLLSLAPSIAIVLP